MINEENITKGALIHMREILISRLRIHMKGLLESRKIVVSSLILPRNYYNKESTIERHRNEMQEHFDSMIALIKFASTAQILNGVNEQGILESWVRHANNETTEFPPISPQFDSKEFDDYTNGFKEILYNKFLEYVKPIDGDEVDDSSVLPGG